MGGAAGRGLQAHFDAVVMLTQSDWRSEPRSNRYHYARRFAARLPTYFVQPDGSHRAIASEPTEIPGLELVHSAWWDEDEDAALAHSPRFRWAGGALPQGAPPSPADSLRLWLTSRGVRRPLLWIYNPNYRAFLLKWPEAFKVFHATEDYTLTEGSGRYFDDAFRTLALEVATSCDLLVAVSDRVRENYARATGLGDRAVVLPNGCDYGFWLGTEAWRYTPDSSRARSLLGRLLPMSAKSRLRVLYQGGVNDRLDLSLLLALSERMPDTDFIFCGAEDEREVSAEAMAPWRVLKTRPNVRALGLQPAERIAEEARRSNVGIIPYAPSELISVSLPLKAYEYLACGLPVVSAPIPSLTGKGDLFAFARTAAEYEAEIRRLAPSRNDEGQVRLRLAAAAAADYDRSFDELQNIIAARIADPRPAGSREWCEAARVVLSRQDGDALQCQAAWQDAGADVQPLGGGAARVTTPRDAWNFAAVLQLKADGADVDARQVQVTVVLEDIEGEARLGVFDEATGNIEYEQTLWPTPGRSVYRLETRGLAGRLLLLRNGAADASVRLTFREAELAILARRSDAVCAAL